jgi:archaellum component FlaG (FlaF/FlaG flagellin family)
LDKTITTVLLIIAGVVCSVFLFNSVYPMISRSSAAMVSMTDKIDDRMKTQINIVHAASTTNPPGGRTIFIWVKNIGSSRIVDMANSDIFLGLEGNFVRVQYEKNSDGSPASLPNWSFEIENDPGNTTEWKIGETLKMTVTYDVDPGTGTYFVKVIMPNGVEDEYYFSM